MAGLVAVETEGMVSAIGLAWQQQNKLRATVVAKAVFSFSGSEIAWLDPEDLVRAEVSYPGDAGIVRWPSECALVVGRAELLFAGRSTTPDARLSLFRDFQPLLQKQVLNNQPGASLGPISSKHASRAALLGGLTTDAFSGAVVELPDAFDRRFFQAAPADQQLDAFCDGDIVEIKNLHPSCRTVRIELPPTTLKATGRLSGVAIDIVMHADTLIVDSEAEQCTLLWRGRFAASKLAALAEASVSVTLQVGEGGSLIKEGAAIPADSPFSETIVLNASPASDVMTTQGPSTVTTTAADAIPFRRDQASVAPPVSAAAHDEHPLSGGTAEITAAEIATLIAAHTTPFDKKAPTPPVAVPPIAVPPAIVPPAEVAPPAIAVAPPAIVADTTSDEVPQPDEDEAVVPESVPPPAIAAEPADEPEAEAAEEPRKEIVADPWAKPPEAAPAPKTKPAEKPGGRKRPDIRGSLYKKF